MNIKYKLREDLFPKWLNFQSSSTFLFSLSLLGNELTAIIK